MFKQARVVLLSSLFMSISWLWRKIFRFSSVDDSSLGPEQRRLLAKQGENGNNYHESRVEKARRKAEEKRQARLEKELSEEEERKQREEVARLVEERRKLRDEKIEAEKCSKVLLAAKEKIVKEAEKKRQERRKERDKASSKSSSDGEEHNKRTGKEIDHKRNVDKDDHLEHDRGSNMERRHDHGIENTATSNGTKSGGRYFDRVKGTFLSSSKAFSDSRLFGRGVITSATIAKETKPIGSTDNSHTSAHTNSHTNANHARSTGVQLDLLKTIHLNTLLRITGSTHDLRPSQLDPETRSQPAYDKRLDIAHDNSLFPFVIRRSQLQLAFPIPARTARDTF
ncbi:hypothetical protein F2Q70_00040744 [Brassica cretica]|uniref:Uncharacterized protein n=1 Tax=Brassica cretica TaxID=69181 RepID=A0A8S9KBY9_BRACR|nr:hypothetical protein F2Q70_00040744 [Brassica cretica]